jgi:hypothetical protein
MDGKINFNEVLTMLYLSSLIYEYHNNIHFDLKSWQTIVNFINKNNMNHYYFKDIKEPMLYLANKYPFSRLHKFISNERTDTQVGIAIDDYLNKIIIIFRGTESLKDCYYDLNLVKEKLDISTAFAGKGPEFVDDILVHKGFLEQSNSVYIDITDIIDSFLNLKNYEIYITGHSLGAATGTILAYFLSEKYKNKIIKLVTFGSPRVGNYNFKQHFNSKDNIIHYRITNNRDTVTSVPSYNYYHVGTHIHLTDDGVEIIPDTYLSYWYGSICHSYNVNDHKLVNYIKNLKNSIDFWDIENYDSSDEEEDDDDDYLSICC